jgi:uncharacterized protein with HEPN domain
MRPEGRKYLGDVARAAGLIAEFTDGKAFADYLGDTMLRAAVEREFQIIGEALARLAQLDAPLVAQISQWQRIVAFRNILVHGYSVVDDQIVWDVVETHLPKLRREVTALTSAP